MARKKDGNKQPEDSFIQPSFDDSVPIRAREDKPSQPSQRDRDPYEEVSDREIRRVRKEERKRYTDTVKRKKRGDDPGPAIARGTNRIYDETFPQGRPEGIRDQWSKDEQVRISTGEHFASNWIGSTNSDDDSIVDDSGRGAREGKAFYEDNKEKGWGAWDWLFGGKDEALPSRDSRDSESRSSSRDDSGQSNQSSDSDDDNSGGILGNFKFW